MDVFSGRPNPTWPLDQDAAHALLRPGVVPPQGHSRGAGSALEDEEVTDEEHQTESTLSCGWETATFVPSWWNDAAHINYNNCYNFATARRTNTFAQPGRATGKQYTALTCDAVQAAA